MSEINWTTVYSCEDALLELRNGTKAIWIDTRYGHEKAFSTFAKALAKNRTCLHLDLSANKIGPEGAKEIADAMKENTTLTTLDLNNNNIGPEGAKEVADALKINTSLTSLNLAINKIGSEGAKVIAKALKINRTLTELNLAYNNIGPEGAKEVADALKINTSLTSLHLYGNYLGAEGAKEVADALKVNTSLTKLDLDYNNIGPEGAKEVADALKINTSLTSLHLNNNNIGPEGAKEVADALKVNTNLTLLNLTANKIGPEGAKEIADAMKENTTLTTLDLPYNEIGPEGARDVADALKVNSSLVELNLKENHIGPEGAKDIADALKGNTSLSSLNLRSNLIGPEGAKDIADALKVNNSLTSLDLFANKIGPEGAKEIADGLKVNSSLAELSLGRNEIENEGAKDIADALKVNTSLTSLDLLFNEIGPEGARDVADALKVNSSLIELDLESNLIGPEGAKEVAGALKQNKTVTTLNLKNNEIGPEEAREIADALKANPMSALINLSGAGEADAFVKERNRQRFLDALKGNEKAEFSRLRVMFVGQGKAGKSATIRSILGKRFNEEWDSTIGADVSETVVSGSKWGDSKDKIDFASALAVKMMNRHKEMKSSSTKRMEKPVVAPLPNSSKTEMNSPQAAKGNQLQKKGHKQSNFVDKDQNKKDLKRNSSVKNDRPKKSPQEDIIREYDVKIMLKAHERKNDLALSLWDFGGQEVFYTMHHIFLTQTGVYVLVFDTRELLDLEKMEEAKKYLLFWLRSINMHAPQAPLLLAGTFCAEIQDEIRGVDKTLRELSKQFTSQIVANDNLVFFPIDNREKLNIQELRKAIEFTARNDRAMKQEVSIRWMAFLDELLSHKKSKSYLTMNGDVNHIAGKFGLSRQEREMALGLFHERGLIIHLTATETLRNIVIIKPQWLIDALGKVIRDSTIHVDLAQYERDGLEEDAKVMFEEGIATRDLLGYLWNYDQTEFFIDLMKRTMLMSDYRNDCFLIPSLLKENKDMGAVDTICVVDFSTTFLPHGVFQRLVCLCVEYESRKTSFNDSVRMNKNYAHFSDFAGQEVELVEDLSRQAILVSSSDVEKVIPIVSSMLLKINSNVMGGRLKWKVLIDGKAFQPEKAVEVESPTLDLDVFLSSL